jgi:hypothetical protein
VLIRIRRLAPFTAVAIGTAIVVLSAPAVAGAAKHLINGSTIKVHSISGNRLKNNTVTGAQIKESTLGTVPLATRAGTALPPSVLPSGHSETGGWETGVAPAGPTTASISFPIPVNGTLTNQIINESTLPADPVPSGCTGSASNPGAKPGNLCIFIASTYGPGTVATFGTINPLTGGEGTSSRFGTTVFGTSTSANTLAGGSWAVTAP